MYVLVYNQLVTLNVQNHGNLKNPVYRTPRSDEKKEKIKKRMKVISFILTYISFT